MAAEKGKRVCTYFATVFVSQSHWELRMSLSLSPFYFTKYPIVNPTVRAAPSLSTGRRFVFTMKSGNVVRLVIIANLAVKLDLIRK